MITAERYYVICKVKNFCNLSFYQQNFYLIYLKPLKVKSVMTQSRTFKIIILIWFVSITINIPYVFPLTEYNIRLYSDNTLGFECNAKSRGLPTFLYIITNTFLSYVVIGIILVYLYNKITQNLNRSNKFLAVSASQSAKNKLEDYPGTEDGQKVLECRCDKDEDIIEDEDDDKNKLSGNNVIKKKFLPEKTSKPSLNKVKLERKEVDTKTIKNRRKLIYMLKFVIILFYVCLFPLKTWSLGKIRY